jgi:Fibronectin type III domain
MRGILILFILTGSLFFATGANSQVMGNGSATISWTPSSSSSVAGYDIYYGTSSGNYQWAVSIDNPNATNVTIRGLANGTTYYFAATSYDSAGTQSGYSPEISGVVGSTTPTAIMLTSLATAPGQYGFSVAGAANTQYIVQASTDLVHWLALQTNTGSFSFVDSNTAQFPQRFYRTVAN